MYEVDYLAVGAETKTGDAIAMRFTDPSDGERRVVVIDGGFVEMSRVKILGRAVESVLKENQIHGKTPFDSG